MYKDYTNAMWGVHCSYCISNFNHNNHLSTVSQGDLRLTIIPKEYHSSKTIFMFGSKD